MNGVKVSSFGDNRHGNDCILNIIIKSSRTCCRLVLCCCNVLFLFVNPTLLIFIPYNAQLYPWFSDDDVLGLFVYENFKIKQH